MVEVIDSQSELDSVRIENYLFLFAITLLYYDHFLTLDEEINLIWRRRRSWSSWLFFFNRYFAFFGNIVAALSLFYPSFSLSLSIFRIVPSTIPSADSGNYQCFFLSSLSQILHRLQYKDVILCQMWKKGAAGWEAIFLFDTLLFVLTILRAHKIRKELDITSLKIGNRPSLLSIVVRDGSIYFAAMASANLLNIVTFYVHSSYVGSYP
ncbi:hypothetical protein K435DRAFT_791049 [Dendrothele bispora CBS 962.96]|uniref:DUF6533 domain-containing protein n=1 Tax=Dendrothele bispora (strain CBS 962.96) TaxID=1314807 RepID=A0A4S8MN43_DENBC|nr:hypothetical protein K435DRAFT_791049 [Dendrothele bispora CBS 962.96]